MKSQHQINKSTQAPDPNTRFAVAFLTLFLATFFLGRTATPQLGVGQIVLLWGLLVPELRSVVMILFMIYYFLE